MGAGGGTLVPTPKFRVSSRGSAGVKFLVWAPIFSYGGSSRGPDGVALRIITCTYHFSVLVVDSPKERIWELGTHCL